MDTQEKFFTVAQVAVMASVTVRTVARWIESGKLKAYRNVEGGPWRITESEWNRFKNASRAELFYRFNTDAPELFR